MDRFANVRFFVLILGVFATNNASASFVTVDCWASLSRDGYIYNPSSYSKWEVYQSLFSVNIGEDYVSSQSFGEYQVASMLRVDTFESSPNIDTYSYTALFNFDISASIPDDNLGGEAYIAAGVHGLALKIDISEKSIFHFTSNLKSIQYYSSDIGSYGDPYFYEGMLPGENIVLDPGIYGFRFGYDNSGGINQAEISMRGSGGTISASATEFIDFSFTRVPQPVPEPETIILFGTGLIGIVARNRRRFLRG